MRVFAAVLLGMSLAASPLLARNADETGKEETSAAASTASAVPDKPTPVKPEASAVESELQDLRSLVEEQRAELEAQRAELKAQQLKMEKLEEKFGPAPSEPVAAAPAPITTAVSSATPISSAAVTAATPAAEPAQKGDDEVSPLQLKIGSAYITPVGFMDFTSVFRSHDAGNGIGTNFAGIPYGNTFNNHLSEFRLSMQNSRIGFRVDALVHGAHVIGYMESDFLGNNAGTVAITSNSNTLRSRLYWVDVQKDKWEILGGQTWSLLTPGRSGISPLPGNIFFTNNIDVNYQSGLVWGRIPELRFVVHPSNKVAFALALDSPEQYIGGSGGLSATAVTFPTALAGLAGTQLNNGTTTLNAPNVAPDFIAKLAFDPSNKFHVELGGLVREFKVWNSAPAPAGTTYSKTGGGGFVNLNAEIFKGFRVLTNNFWADGGGRYLFGEVPDLIIRADDSISPIKAASTVSGFELTHGKSLLYFYYGGIYVYRNLAFDTNGTSIIGYGTSSSGDNRFIQEGTIGFNQTLWRDAKYGALNFMGQYSYLNRDPWATLNPSDAHINMVFLNLRYTLPGSAPTLGK